MSVSAHSSLLASYNNVWQKDGRLQRYQVQSYFTKKTQLITEPHLRLSRINRCAKIFIRYWKIQKEEVTNTSTLEKLQFKGDKGLVYCIDIFPNSLLKYGVPSAVELKEPSTFMMISALHPVHPPMKRYPASIQTERLMNIF